MTPTAIAAALVLAQAAPATLTYGDALREALSRNHDLKATRARLDQARAIAWKAWASQLPRITAAASWTRNDKSVEIPALPPLIPEAITFQPLIGRTAQVQATIPVFAPQLWFEISAAEAAQRQAEATVETARRGIVFDVARLYHGAVGSKYAVQIARKQLAVAHDHEEDAGTRYQTDTTPRVALLRAEIDRARAEQDLEAARAGYDSVRVALATVLDRQGSDFEVESPSEELPVLADGDLEASALRNRPEVQAAAAALAAAERARAAVRSGYLPTIGAFGRVQWQDPAVLRDERQSWAIGLALTWNLFDGTLREALLDESGAKVAEAEANRRSTELKAREAVVRARLDLQAAIANRKKAQEQVELARENQRLVEVSYKEGAASYIEVSDANGQLFAAELAALNEQVKSRLAALRLLEAAGRFEPG